LFSLFSKCNRKLLSPGMCSSSPGTWFPTLQKIKKESPSSSRFQGLCKIFKNKVNTFLPNTRNRVLRDTASHQETGFLCRVSVFPLSVRIHTHKINKIRTYCFMSIIYYFYQVSFACLYTHNIYIYVYKCMAHVYIMRYLLMTPSEKFDLFFCWIRYFQSQTAV
jgi:hypothetical protein